MAVEHLFISPGHNYVGHHGVPPGTHPLVELMEVECVAGRGLRGDRYFDHREDYKGQVTFFAMEVLEALRQELDLTEATPSRTRRNVFTRGLHLPDLIGKEFALQGVYFLGTEECRPCYWMNEAFRDPRVEHWLAGKGGLRARIRSSGLLRRHGHRLPSNHGRNPPPAE
ncbi:MAG: MOSC domain-containing protein [Verrucomicrobiales bacterium]|nr:MOSC domain-containing protein [Verrucomicrobiales bacterium]